MSIEYRREIDGLRAVAVLPVILFHAGVSAFSGGFVGVDIFFVISGYLITSILAKELDEGSYSIARFYERRARRILPALFLVILFCIPVAWLLMLPPQFASFSRSVGWVTLFASNIFFWLNSGYFSANAELQPLLHTWSLAVEEQYYVLFPPVLALLWKLGRRRLIMLLTLAALVSLAAAEWGWRHSPDANFYFAPTRAWELFAGSLCAFAGNRSTPRDQVSGIAGLFLIAFSILVFDGSVPFPSIYALVPVVGTALVILRGGAGTLTGRILSHRAFVGIGLISYSAYLWHQPLFAFARIASFSEPSPFLMAALVVATFVLAWASWRWVEAPFRRSGGVFPTRAKLFAGAALVGALLALPMFWLSRQTGVTAVELQHPELFREPVIAAAPFAPCEGFEAVKKGDATCRKYGTGPRRIVIWGDSHAEVLAKSITPLPGSTIYLVAHLGCPPVAGAARSDGKGNCSDPAILDGYFDYVRARQPSDVVLLARWSLYAYGWRRFDKLQPITYFLTDRPAPTASAPESAAALRRALDRTLAGFASETRVLIVTQPPDLQAYSDRTLAFVPDVPADEVRKWHAGEMAILQDTSTQHHAALLDAKTVFCDPASCRVRTMEGYRNYSDENHLSAVGLRQLWHKIAEELTRPTQP